MPSMDKDIKEKQEVQNRLDYAEAASYVVAVGAGGYAFRESVSNKLYDNLKSLGWLGDEIATHKKEARGVSGTVGKDAGKKLEIFHQRFSKMFGSRLKELDMETMLKQFAGLHSNQKMEATLHGATVAGAVAVGLGAVISLAEKKALAKQLEEKKEQLDKQLGVYM